MLGFFQNIFRSNKSYYEQLLEVLLQTENVSRVINNESPGIYNFLSLIIDIYDIIPHISVKHLCNIKDLNVKGLRLIPTICESIINIRRDLRSITDFIDDDSCSESELNLDELSMSIEPFCMEISHRHFQIEPVLSEWPINKQKEHEYYRDNPSAEEKSIFEHIYDYEFYSAGKCKELMPLFRSLVEKFEKKTDEVLQCLIPIDKILLQIYAKIDKSRGQEIRDSIDSYVSKKIGRIKLSQTDYEDYYLHDYLTELKYKSESDSICFHIYNAHQVHKPLSITDENIKRFIFSDKTINDDELRKLVIKIIQITYLKETCGLMPVIEPNAQAETGQLTASGGFTAFTMKIDGVTITETKLKEFLINLHKNVKFELQDGLVLYDVMIIHGLTDATINRKNFVNDVNALAGLEVLSYSNCKNYDDLEFHRKIDEWRANEVKKNYYKDFDKFSKRKKLARSVEFYLLKLKGN